MFSEELATNDRIYRHVWTGERNEPQPLTVIRENRKTVTVRTDDGARMLVSFADIIGRWTDR